MWRPGPPSQAIRDASQTFDSGPNERLLRRGLCSPRMTARPNGLIDLTNKLLRSLAKSRGTQYKNSTKMVQKW